jgi:hypothetical protein
MNRLPLRVTAGDTVQWVEPIVSRNGEDVRSDEWGCTVYFRFNAASEGLTITGAPLADGTWSLSISANVSASMDAGTWYWQRRFQRNAEVFTEGKGTIEIESTLVYQGTPGAYDGRSQARKDLESVQAAIRTLISGGAVQEYTIGSRTLKKMRLSELIQLESKLKADVVREERAESLANGLGDPRKLYVRFRR